MKHKKLIIVLTCVFCILIAAAVASAIYVADYYHASTAALSYASKAEKTDAEYLVFGDVKSEKALIFYPGGKVEYSAYSPLMEKLSENGFLCILLKMPFNRAVFDMNAAQGIQEKYPLVEDWYLGGHSLGGAMAASFAAKNTNSYKGLVLLAAYSTEDISQSGLKVLTIYGSNDNVLDMEKVNENSGFLPKTAQTVVIDGGCYAYFGSYGAQDGDGIPTITEEEQISKTVEAIVNMAK